MCCWLVTHVVAHDPFVLLLLFQCPDSPTDDDDGDSLSDTDEEPAAKHRKLSPAAELSFRFGAAGVELQSGSQEVFHFYGDSVQSYVSNRWLITNNWVA